jgi:hypothetical protein
MRREFSARLACERELGFPQPFFRKYNIRVLILCIFENLFGYHMVLIELVSKKIRRAFWRGCRDMKPIAITLNRRHITRAYPRFIIQEQRAIDRDAAHRRVCQL